MTNRKHANYSFNQINVYPQTTIRLPLTLLCRFVFIYIAYESKSPCCTLLLTTYEHLVNALPYIMSDGFVRDACRRFKRI